MTGNWDDMVLVGIVARPHGVRGEVVVNPETDFVDTRFKAGSTLWTQRAGVLQPLSIVSMRVQQGRPVVTLTGVSDREAAERLAGLELRMPAADLQPLAEGQYYEHDLVGCSVNTAAGDHVGVVVRIDRGAGGRLLAIDGPRGEILIPFVQDICLDVDVARQRIRIQPPDGLLELNETKRSRTPVDESGAC